VRDGGEKGDPYEQVKDWPSGGTAEAPTTTKNPLFHKRKNQRIPKNTGTSCEGD